MTKQCIRKQSSSIFPAVIIDKLRHLAGHLADEEIHHELAGAIFLILLSHADGPLIHIGAQVSLIVEGTHGR